MRRSWFVAALIGAWVFWGVLGAKAADPPHAVMTWVKRHPAQKPQGKPSPRMGYETSYGYDPLRKVLIRYAGHNQGGGGEQNSEVWTYDLAGDAWELKEPGDAPPGVCCAQQNVFDDALRRFIRFPAFSGSHGWQSPREIYLKNSSAWTYDLDANTWRAMRPCPEVWPSPLRGAAYDPQHQVTVLHGGEGSRHGTVVYDLYTNAWRQMKPEGGPEAGVSQPGFAYDEVHRLFVLFGSQFQEDERTWVYDLRKNQWRVLDVAEHPPGKKSCPVMAADTRNGIVLCNVFVGDVLQTWALDVARPKWTHLKLDPEPGVSGARNRVLIYLPDVNLFVLENRVRDEQQIWTFRYAEAPPPPARPTGLTVITDAAGATLRWDRPPGGSKLHYCVDRATGDAPWEADFQQVAAKVDQATFQDKGLEQGTVYYYRVRALESGGKEAGTSLIARTQPPVVVDVRASVPDAKRVELLWPKPAAEDVVGYHVDRAAVNVYSTDEVKRIKQRYRNTCEMAAGRIKRIGPFARLTDRPLTATRFVDDSIDLSAGQKEPPEPFSGGEALGAEQVDSQGKPYRFAVYAYRVIAVNRLGVAGGPSPLVFTWPAAVQHVFAKEEGTDKARLKWQVLPGKAVAGYLVYRQDGRWDKDPISRLTPQPIRATEFLDETAGPGTRRYEIVAVDALGQEGEPSRPVWSRREWGKYYVPYVGQWHQ